MARTSQQAKIGDALILAGAILIVAGVFIVAYTEATTLNLLLLDDVLLGHLLAGNGLTTLIIGIILYLTAPKK